VRIRSADRSLAVIGAVQTASLNYGALILEILQTSFLPGRKRECTADRPSEGWCTLGSFFSLPAIFLHWF